MRHAAACFLFFTAALTAQTWTVIGQTGTVIGTVTDSVTHQLLEGVEIQITAKDKTVRKATDLNGEYRFNFIPAGRATLEFTKERYVRQSAFIYPAECFLDVKAGEFVRRNIALQPGGTIQGRLLDRETDAPLSGYEVSALQQDYGVGAKRYIPLTHSKPSNALGEFLLVGLPSGNYIIEAKSTERPQVSVDQKDEHNKLVYPTTYFPGVSRRDLAVPVILSSGDARTLDLRLSRGGVRSISGTVELPTGTDKVHILLEREQPSSFETVANGTVAAPGPFRISHLSEGSFTLMVFTGDAVHPSFLEYPIEIESRDISDLKLRLIPSLTVKGLTQPAKDAGERPLAKMKFRLAPTKRIMMQGEGEETPIASSGEFERSGVLAGSYFPELVGIPLGWAVTEVRYQAGSHVYGEAVLFDGRAIDNTLLFFLSPKLGSATGSVRNNNGNPVVGLKLVLLPYPIPATYNPFNFRIRTTDPQGNFSFDQLPPGKYQAIPLTGIEAKSDHDLELLRQKAISLDPFEVQAGQVATVAVKP